MSWSPPSTCCVPVVSQFYITEAENEYVIKGNSAIVKCKIPSFVTDFVSIDSWIFDDGMVLFQNDSNATNYGTIWTMDIVVLDCVLAHSPHSLIHFQSFNTLN